MVSRMKGICYYLRNSTVSMGWVPKNSAGTIPIISLDFGKWSPVTSNLIKSSP